MRRQRRKRSTRRRGLQHVGDVLAELITDIDLQEAAEANTAPVRETPGIVVNSVSVDTQDTFAFYQTAEV